jgi:hypothetical protein
MAKGRRCARPLAEIVKRRFATDGKYRLAPIFEVICRSLSEILVGNANVWLPLFVRIKNSDVLKSHICPELPFGGFVRASYQIASGQPERKGGEEKQGGESGNKSIGNLKRIPVERRPELGSFLFAVLCLGLAFTAAAFADDAWRAGTLGATMFCIVALIFNNACVSPAMTMSSETNIVTINGLKRCIGPRR